MKQNYRSKTTYFLATTWTLCAVASALAQEEKREQREPSFSGDSRKFVYREDVKKGGEVLPSSSEIWVVNADGTNPRRLTTGFKDDQPRFSPDGQQIAFERGDDIWLINADGTQLRNLTASPNIYESNPEFTNDGRHLLYIRARSLVRRNLADGSESTLLPGAFDIRQAVPDPMDDNLIIINSKPLDANGRPTEKITFSRVIAAYRHYAGISTLLAPETGQNREIGKVLVGGFHVLVNVRDIAADFSSELKVLDITNGNNVKTIPGLISADTISRDGSKVAYIGLIGGDLGWGIVLRDLETQKAGALKTFADAIPEPAKKHLELGMEHFHADRYDEAIGEFTQAIVLYPQYAEAFYYRGWTHDMKDDEASALRDLAEAIRLDPQGRHGASAYITRAQVFVRQERSGEALDDYTAAIAITPNNQYAYFERGEIYRKRLEPDLALADYDKAIELSPKSLSSRLARGDLLAELGDNARALIDYSAAIEHFPDWPGTYERRAKLYRAMGNADLATADEQKFKELKAQP